LPHPHPFGIYPSLKKFSVREQEQPLVPKFRRSKLAEMEDINNSLEPGKKVILIGDSIIRNTERFGKDYDKYFPTSTVVNAGIAGDTVEAILYRVQNMNFPSSIRHISILCGTNNLASTSPSTISVTVIEIISVIFAKCPSAFIHIFPILPRFDQYHQLVQVTNSHIHFQVQDCFSDNIFFHDLPPSLYNKNVYRDDRIHLTNKGNDILVRWIHYSMNWDHTHTEPSSFHPAPSPCLSTSAADWPPLPSPSPKVSPPRACPPKFRSTPYLTQTRTKSSPNQPSPHHAQKPSRPQHAPEPCPPQHTPKARPSSSQHIPKANPCPAQHASQPSPPQYTPKTKPCPPQHTPKAKSSPPQHTPKAMPSPSQHTPKAMLSPPLHNSNPYPPQNTTNPNPSQQTPKPSPLQHSPRHGSPKPSPFQQTQKPSPLIQTPMPRPPKQTQRPNPTQQTVKPSPPQASPPQQAWKHSPPKETLKPSPLKQTEKPSPPKQTEKPSPPKQTEKPSPPKQTEKPSPPKQTEKPSPLKQTEDPTPPKQTDDPTPPKQTEDLSPPEPSSKSNFTRASKQPTILHFFSIYLLTCLPFLILFVLAQSNVHFLAMVLPFPVIVIMALFSILFIDSLYTGNYRQNCPHKSNMKTNGSSNEQIEQDKLTQDNAHVKMQDNMHNSNETVQPGEQISADTCSSILVLIKTILCVFLLYECHFDFIYHLPITTCSLRIFLAVFLRVQFSLIIISMYVLPGKIVCSLVTICESVNSETDSSSKCIQLDSVCNVFHIMRFQTRKHKKQRLVLRKNWKSLLNRITNFQKRLTKRLYAEKNLQEQNSQSQKFKNKSQVSALTEIFTSHLLFGLSVLFLPGLIVIIFVIPKIQTFSKFLHNLPHSDWLEKVTMCYSYLFSKLQYLFISAVIFGNMAMSSFFTAFLLENFPISTYAYLISVSPVVRNILQLSSFSSFVFLYLILLYVGEYGIFLLVSCFGVLFVKLTGESLTVSNLWSGGTLLGIFSTFENILIDLLNIHLSLPGNLLCFVPPFKTVISQIFVKDWHGKTHTFQLPQTATVSDLVKQISVKFKLSQRDYWLSGPGGKKMEKDEKLLNLTTIHIRGRLNGGTNICCIKGCTEVASKRKITCLSGVYELKVPPDMLQQENDLNSTLYICNHHYYFQTKRGHKPRKLYSSVKYAKKNFFSEKSKTSDSLSPLGVKTCTFCKKGIAVTSTTPCLQHIITLSSKKYMCAGNCLDELRKGKIQEINSGIYDCISDRGNELQLEECDLDVLSYLCTECCSISLLSIKAEKAINDSGSASKPENVSTEKTAQIGNITFPFSKALVDLIHNSNRKINNYEAILDMFLSLSKVDFVPWTVNLQHGQTGVMLHFMLNKTAETLATKMLTIFCPFLFGAPYQISFSVYALGKQVDSGFLPDNWFENKMQARHTISVLLQTFFSIPLCLGIYGERFLNAINIRQPTDSDTGKSYEVDYKFLLVNCYGKTIGQTIRSVNSDLPCQRLVLQSQGERCQNCNILLKNTNIFHENRTSSNRCSSDSRTAISKLSYEELVERYKNLRKTCDYWKKRTRSYMKKKKLMHPLNFNITSIHLGMLIDMAVEKNLLHQNSILYLLLMDTVIGLQKQDKEFKKSNGKLTKSQKKQRAKGMRYHPLVIKWCCSLASKCQEKGYESMRNILPLPHWQTIKQYRQTSCSSEPMNQENLRRMVQEMERRNCKGIGGIHWDEMIIQEGIVVCKRTGELVGFENFDIPPEFTDDFNRMQNENCESDICDSDSSDSESSESSSSSSSAENDSNEYPKSKNQFRAKMICQFFFSSIEGDFSWPVASFPVRRMKSENLRELVWKVIEVLSKTTIYKNKNIQVLYGVCDGSSYSHAFFRKSNVQNWVCFNPYNNNVPIWWLSDYPHLIKKLRNFIVNPNRNMEWAEQKLKAEHLIDVVERKQTKLRWKHIKLSARTKMSVKRAVEVCSEEVVDDICEGSFPLEETIGTRMYLSMCAKLFKIMNNSTEVDPSSYRELLNILIWFRKWHTEIQITMPEKGRRKAHWKKFITERTFKDLQTVHKGIFRLSTIYSNELS